MSLLRVFQPVHFIYGLFYAEFFIDEEFQVVRNKKGMRIKKSFEDIPFYDRKGLMVFVNLMYSISWLWSVSLRLNHVLLMICRDINGDNA